jgi:hypothetical protein
MATQTATPVRTGSRQTPSRQTPTRQTPASARAKNKEYAKPKPFSMPFDRRNIMIMLAGVAVIVLGYLLMYISPTMSDMALTVSPILLVLGYCVVVPFGIMAGIRKKPSAAPASEPTTNGAV